MLKQLLICTLAITAIGCGNKISPLSPELKQEINGEVDEIRNNQNGIMAELGKLQQQVEINARDIKNMQNGMVNINKDNSGIQILQGDGSLILIFALATIAMLLYHYRLRAVKSEKTAEILAQQIALHEDEDLNNKVFSAAIDEKVEKEVYKLIVKNQKTT